MAYYVTGIVWRALEALTHLIFTSNRIDHCKFACSSKRRCRDIPCTLCPVSPTGTILQNYSVILSQDIDTDTIINCVQVSPVFFVLICVCVCASVCVYYNFITFLYSGIYQHSYNNGQCLILVFQKSYWNVIIQYVTFEIGCFSLSIIPSRFFQVVAYIKCVSFYGWVVFHSAMFPYQLAWAAVCPDIWSNTIPGVSVRVFLEENNIWIHRLSKADCPP